MTTTITKNLSQRLTSMREKTINAAQEVSLVRALEITEVIKYNPDLPRNIQFAIGLKNTFQNLKISISDDDRIVGAPTDKLKGAALYPEMKSDFIRKEINNFEERENDRFVISDYEKKQIKEMIMPFWDGKSGYDNMMAKIDENIDFNMRNLAIVIMPDFVGANLLTYVNYEKVLNKGLNGIIEEAKASMNSINDNDSEFIGKKDFYNSIIITLEGIINFAERYSKIAIELANKAESSKQAEILKEIARVTKKVPAGQSNTFREAVQSYWFTIIALMQMDIPIELALGRMDQILYPFLKNDMDNGRITKDDALEFVEELFIKINRSCILNEYVVAKIFDGNNLRQTVTLGGINNNGISAVNPLTYIILDAVDNLKLIYPNIAVRLHPDLPNEFWKRITRMMTDGSNLIEVFNDEVIISGFMNHGFTADESRNYIIGGCVQPIPAGTYGPNCSTFINGAKVLEMTLNGGKPYVSMSGDEEDIDSPIHDTYEELWNEYKLQLNSVVKTAVDGMNVVDRVQQDELPNPVLSAVTEGSLESGRDVKAGGAKKNYTGVSFIGLGTVTDSLATIKELVYDKKTYSLTEVINWIKSDYDGYEVERQFILNHIPKYGNDIQWVDKIAADIVDYFAEILSEYKTHRGGIYGPGIHTENHHIIQGIVVAATPDGRKSGEMMSTGCGATSGMDKSGPTGALRSFASIDYKKLISGSSINLRFNPSLLRTDDQVDKFEALLRGYFKLGGQHLQISVVDAATLREAQKYPEKYQDLIVRVVGYSARFVDLTIPLQEEIIKRTEMNVCA